MHSAIRYWRSRSVDTVQKQYLQKGVIMSLAGHIVRLEAVTDTGLGVDDPFGASTIGHEEGNSGKYYRIRKIAMIVIAGRPITTKAKISSTPGRMLKIIRCDQFTRSKPKGDRGAVKTA